MRKDFYIFRHGETDVNKEGRRQGQKIDAELNEKGIEQAKNLAEKLCGMGIEKIYSSPLKRAKKTAEVVSEKLCVDIEYMDGLKEGCFGIFEGLLRSDIMKNYPMEHELWESFSNEHYDYALPGGESKREISERMQKSLESLLNTKYNTVAISTHGRITRLYLWRLGLELKWMENAAFYHVVYNDGRWFIEK